MARETLDQRHEGSLRKRTTVTPLPKVQLFTLLYLLLAEPITSTVIRPFIVKFIDETGITDDVSKTGYYAGLVESLFFLTEALMILQWGRLSDRIGRKPILLTGLSGLCLSMLCFGLSRTFWAIVASRALAGALNGNAGVIKCMLSEITDETNLDRGLSFMPITSSLGSTIGPLIGGLLQHPYERFGGVFRLSTFWETNPYFLPCAIAALYSTSAFILTYLLLKETVPSVIQLESQFLPRGLRHRILVSADTRTTATECTPLIPDAPTKKHISLRELLTPRVVAAMTNYALLALTDISFFVLLPVFLSTPIPNGGLGMSPTLVGICLAGYGVVNGAVSIFFFVPLHRRFGTRTMLWTCEAAFVVCYAFFPVMNELAKVHNDRSLAVWILLVIQLATVTLPTMAFSAVVIFLTSSVPSRSALGATTGLAQTLTSIMRAIGPAGATSLFALSNEYNLLGGTFVYVVFCIISATGSLAAMLLPAMPWAKEDSMH